MKGDAEVLKVLGEVLTAELSSINQYFVHSEMCDRWRYAQLAAQIRKESFDEMKHAEKLIERILYLDTTPNVQRYLDIHIGKDVKDMLQFDLEVERDAVERLNAGIALWLKKGDNGSRELLSAILEDQENHIEWLEAQLEQIKQMGLENYLSSITDKEEKS